MARLDPTTPRKPKQGEQYLGKVILFCEGHTENNYFDHFATIINNNQNKYSHIEVVPILADGNARRVLNFANEYMSDENHAKKYSMYYKYLIFDCDDPDDISQVIFDMRRANSYTLMPTNLVFETWLLMHFEDISSPLTKSKTYQNLADALGIGYYGDKEKASEGIIRKIIGNGDSVRMAIINAKRLDQIYQDKNYTIEKDIKEMNPYTALHILVENIFIELQRADSIL
ncbi:MAG TPA: RloB family protein [Bacillota bacterium]|nr:RloB family protein [Bacillota bacterium]